MTAARIELRSLPVDDLTIGEDVRLDEDPEALAELAESIKEHGVLQALTVRPAARGWEVVAGRRRLAAARIAGLTDVPCTIRALDDATALDIALTENIHRRALSPIEEALAYAKLAEGGLTHAAIGARVRRSQVHVSRLIRLLELPAELRDRVHRREIAYMTALDLWGRKRTRSDAGGKSTKGKLTGQDADIATHWRRRHDRLMAGIRKTITTATDTNWRAALEAVIKLDLRPLDPVDPGQLAARVRELKREGYATQTIARMTRCTVDEVTAALQRAV